MSLWVILAIVAYLLFAVKGVFDKFLISKEVKHARAMAFYIGMTAPFVLILLPFGFEFLSLADTAVAMLAGASFLYALYFFFEGIKQTSISRILPIEGGLVPIFTLVLAYFIVDERLTYSQYWAFFYLVLGAVLISLKRGKNGLVPMGLLSGVIAAFLFGLSHVLTKYIFDVTTFASGLIWTRAGIFVAALSLLVTKRNRDIIASAPGKTNSKNHFMFLLAHIFGVTAGFLQNYSISIGFVSIVNALQGVQDVFILMISLFMSKYHPDILKEKVTPGIVLQKILAIIVISFGLFLLAF